MAEIVKEPLALKTKLLRKFYFVFFINSKESRIRNLVSIYLQVVGLFSANLSCLLFTVSFSRAAGKINPLILTFYPTVSTII